MSEERASLALTVDVEGEWFELPGEQGSFDVGRVLEAVYHLEARLARLESRIEAKIPITWFIRCDDSVAATTGHASGLLQALKDFVARRMARGDEFGLHPHLYECSDGKWTSQANPEGQKGQLESAAEAWKKYFGSGPRLSRLGEAVMNNEIAGCLDGLGIEIDSSALSGRKRSDSGFQFDWTGTPTSAYRPSVPDYRRPARKDEAERRFVEVPFTMLPMLGPQDREPIWRYCNLSFFPNLIKNALMKVERPEFLVAVVHPHELLPGGKAHPLIAHQPTSLEENIGNIRAALGDLNFTLLSACVRGARE